RGWCPGAWGSWSRARRAPTAAWPGRSGRAPLLRPPAPTSAGARGAPRGSSQGLHLDGDDRGEIANDRGPVVTGVRRGIDLPSGGTEIHAARVERLDRHRVAPHVNVAIALWQRHSELIPF